MAIPLNTDVPILLNGTDEDDTLFFDDSSGTYDGGVGFDTLQVLLTAGVSLAQAELISIERLAFSIDTPGTQQAIITSLDQLASAGVTTIRGSDANNVLQINLPTTGGSFAIPTLTFESWTTGDPRGNETDIVILSAGLSNESYTLTARDDYGSIQLLAGGYGQDTLIGGNGIDILVSSINGTSSDQMFGGAGDDVLVLQDPTAGHLFDGGDDFDTLFVAGLQTFAGTVTDVEALYLAPTPSLIENPFDPNISFRDIARITTDTADFNAQLSGLEFDGIGIVEIMTSAGDDIDLSAVNLAAGSLVGFQIQGNNAPQGQNTNVTWIGSSSIDNFNTSDGNYTITGGAGLDIFEPRSFADSTVSITITDFNTSEDLLDLTHTAFRSFSQLELDGAQVGDDTVISITEGTSLVEITLQNVALSSLTADSFVLPLEQDEDLIGTDDPETIRGFEGDDRIEGRSGDDTLIGGDGDDRLIGEAGNDRLEGNAGDDFLVGGPGDDEVFGGEGTDQLQGGFNDHRFPDPVSNLISMTPESDYLGNDIFDGGPGIDTVSFDFGTTPLTVDLRITGPQDTGYGMDTFVDVESVRGTPESDTIIGNDLTNFISGGGVFSVAADHSDTLRGMGGNDRLTTYSGDHIVDGGEGEDVFQAAVSGGAQISLMLQGQSQDTGGGTVTLTNIEHLLGAIGDDMLTGDANANFLSGFRGSDTLWGDGGDDFLYGDSLLGVDDSGVVVADLPVPFPDVSADTLNGGDGNDHLFGENGNDTLYGGSGNDILFGDHEMPDANTSGNDSLFGEAGDDILHGGFGADGLDGGTGIDTAVFDFVRADYTIEEISPYVFEVEFSRGGTNVVSGVEFLQFADQTIQIQPANGIAVDFNAADPSDYQQAMQEIRDYDGNDLGGDGSWLRIGEADVDGDGDLDQILVNDAIGRFATVGGSDDGLSYFNDHGALGETRVVGIYIDPLVESGDVEAGGPFDSQRRFQNDLEIGNIASVLGAEDYDGDGLQEVYFALTDGTAYLHAYMHADGNIQYANYQNEQQVIDFLESNGFGEETYGDWFA